MEYHWTVGQLITGIVVAGIGFILVWKADWFLINFGSVPFAEKYISSEGGSRLFYKLIGILLIIGGFMHATGLLGPTVIGLARKFFGNSLPQ